MITGQPPEADRATPKSRWRLRGLELNAIALMASSGMTALFGLVFWAVAARYPAEEVGRTSALISTAMMLSTVAGLAVGLVFARFLGSVGPRAGRMVLGGYVVTGVIALVLGAGFVVLFADDALFASTTERFAFPLLVVVLALFTLQDWVLIGLQAARWVPVEQLLFSGIKFGLVSIFAVSALRNGIVIAWVAPSALAVVVVSAVLFLRVLPRRVVVEGAVALPGRRTLARLIAGEYAEGAMAVVVPLLMPLIVVTQWGTQANAYYALPWLISEAVVSLMWNVSSSYLAEASNDIGNMAALTRRTARLLALIALAGTPSLFFGAPLLLSLLPGAYAAEGTVLLQMMGLALPLAAIGSLYGAILRARQQVGRMVALQLVNGISVVALALVLVKPWGITGIGVAYLASEALCFAIVLGPLVRNIRQRPEVNPTS
ncbi:lipopolysaccharide biosynthesis protein [Pseudonocardia sp. GCM10023141]|uniref:lipopolysaccharide biosynthesis protein n=1 Tax=Pseudonocardia sp. GCM10023141 TaxID=3252653 RepID=UPI003613B0A8